MKKTDFYDFLRKIPKAEIHLHAEGTIHPDTVRMLLDRNPETKGQNVDVKALFSSSSLKEFISAFLYIQGLLRTPEDLRIMLKDVETYLRANNIVYCELFFSPSLFLKKGFTFPAMISTLHESLREIQADGIIKIKLIIDVSRTFGQENAQHNLTETLKHLNPDIIGIGLGGDEQKGPARDFGPVFAEARKKGLRVVAHAGEDAGPESIWDALRILNVERVGHGISAIQDPALLAHLKEKQIPIEICLTSNIFTQRYVSKAEDHPVRPFFDQGILTVINTDDPTFFNATLIDEFWTLHTKLKFSMEEIKVLITNGFKASFLNEKEKADYITQVDNAWEKASKK